MLTYSYSPTLPPSYSQPELLFPPCENVTICPWLGVFLSSKPVSTLSQRFHHNQQTPLSLEKPCKLSLQSKTISHIVQTFSLRPSHCSMTNLKLSSRAHSSARDQPRLRLEAETGVEVGLATRKSLSKDDDESMEASAWVEIIL